jgi:enoyl-CoA hydratase
MVYKTISLEEKDGLGLITLRRSQALNSLNTDFFLELNQAMDDLSPKTAIVILTGEGKAFAAGADIAEMVDKGEEAARSFSKLGQDTFLRMENSEQIWIAAVNGYALGGGCELAMACDFRIAGEKALFGQPEVNLGLIPGFAASVRLPRHIGMGNALMLLVTGESVKAADALQMGLVSRVVEQDKLMEECQQIARLILQKGPEAVKKVKAVTRQAARVNYEKGHEIENEQFGSLFGPGKQGAEGMKAFLEKRKPLW